MTQILQSAPSIISLESEQFAQRTKDAVFEIDQTLRTRFQKAEDLVTRIKNEYPEVGAVLERRQGYQSVESTLTQLQDLGVIPQRSPTPHHMLNLQRSQLPASHIKDGYLYAFRGDYTDLKETGIVSGMIRRYLLPLNTLLEVLKDEELHSHFNYRPSNKLEEFMWIHSNAGYEAFVSLTPEFRVAAKSPFHKTDRGSVYVIRIPSEIAFANYASVAEGYEGEILVPDLIKPSEIIATLNSKDYDRYGPDISQFMD